MTRKKVKLVWIVSDNARKASFKKRRLGLMKKVSELTTLCGVYAFAIVYGPDDEHPIIWPSLPAAQHLYRRFHNLPEVERQKKMTNQETYLKERAAKAQDLLKKSVKKNQELEIDILMHQLHQGRQIYQLSNAELLGLFWTIEEKMRECRKRIEYHQQVHRLPPPPTGLFIDSLIQTQEGELGGTTTPTPDHDMDLLDNSRTMMDQWFIDMVMNSNSNDKIGGTSSSMAGELGFQSEANGPANSMVPEIGHLGGNLTITAEDNLLSDWNFGGNGSGMIEIEKLVSNINATPMDLSHQQGDYGIGIAGIGDVHMSLYSTAGAGISANDDAEMLFRGLFGSGSSNEKLNGNENEDEDDDDDLLSKEWPNNYAP